MKKYLLAMAATLVCQISYADLISISCKNTKIPGVQELVLGSGEDFGKSGALGGSNWGLSLNGQDINQGHVQVIRTDAGHISGFKLAFSDEALYFSLADESRAFVFLLSETGNRVPNTTSFCSVDED